MQPGHHKHQTGIYWGFTRVNGRDFFHNPKGDYWNRKDIRVIEAQGDSVKWETVYDLLDANGNAMLHRGPALVDDFRKRPARA